jgi:uncharacterized integral membrane protein (TIGR00697 family)
MGLNEFLLFLSAFLCVGFILAAWKLNRERLHSAIILFLILISLVGAKTATFFGFETNVGNIFYASVFLATYFLIERYGRKEGIRSIWIGVICVVFFSILLRISLAFVAAPNTLALGDALSAALSPSLRLAIASLFAYILSQNLNVYLYTYLKELLARKYLWLRVNLSNLLAQLVDSLVFFFIAFWGVVAPPDIWGIVLTGYIIKVVFVMCASSTLYLNKIQEEEDKDHSSVTLYP